MDSTRRGFLTVSGASAAAFFLGAASPSSASAADATEPIARSYIYVNLNSGTATRRGQTVPLADVVGGNRQTGSEVENIARAMLPFTGASTSQNRLPNGLEWHGSSSPKTLRAAEPHALSWRGQNTSSRYMGGIRTAFDVAAAGETVLVSLQAALSDVSGAPPASLRISLLRVSDSRSTLLERVTTHLEGDGLPTLASLTAPTGGSGGYRLVFTAEAGTTEPGQSATVTVRNLTIIRPSTPGFLGPRYVVPPYSATGWQRGTLVVKHGAPAQNYYLILKTAEAGWLGVPFTVQQGQTEVNVSALLGVNTRLTVQEILMIAAQRWTPGWMSRLAGAGTWLPIRFMELNSAYGSPRPESYSRMSRATGTVGAASVAQGADQPTSLPSLDAPAETWAASVNRDTWSHVRFQTNQRKYIRETTEPSGVRSELHFSRSLAFGPTYWLSFWFRTTTEVLDTVDSRKNIIFQLRYTKNPTGDSSALGPEFSLEQLPGKRFALVFRSDGGRPVLSGAGAPAGISTTTLGPWAANKGSWQRLVASVQLSKQGAGSVQAWLNGSRLAGPAGPIGYSRQDGPKVRFGSYKFSDYPANVEFQNFEFGETDLSSRVALPLPI